MLKLIYNLISNMYHYKYPRALTNRERACLQTFPISYKFYGNKTSVRKQIGMAVPPLAAKAIFTNILKYRLDIGMLN